MDKDYVGISIEAYTRYIYDHRPTYDGRDVRYFEYLTDAEKDDWKARALHQISQFEFNANCTVTDRNGTPIRENDILHMNIEDDDWYDVVVFKDGRLELGEFEQEHAHIYPTLLSVADTSEIVSDSDDFMSAWTDAQQRLDFMDMYGDNYTKDSLLADRAQARHMQQVIEQTLGEDFEQLKGTYYDN